MSYQELAIIGGVAGGIFAVLNNAIKFASDAIPRRNGNGNGHNKDTVIGDLAVLLTMVESFKESHNEIRKQGNRIYEEIRDQRADNKILLDKLTTHFEDFKCLKGVVGG